MSGGREALCLELGLSQYRTSSAKALLGKKSAPQNPGAGNSAVLLASMRNGVNLLKS